MISPESGGHIPEDKKHTYEQNESPLSSYISEIVELDTKTAGTSTYSIEDGESRFVAKIYHHQPQPAERERYAYRVFNNDFTPKLRYASSSEDTAKQVLVFDFVDGDVLDDKLKTFKEKNEVVPLDLAYQAIDQIYALNKEFPPDAAIPVASSTPLKKPIREGFLSDADRIAFMQAYEPVIQKSNETIEKMPGYYFDRNPRNMIIYNNQITQIDFGRIEKTSAMFDLVKLLRNGVVLSAPLTSENQSLSNNDLEQLSVYTVDQEQNILDYAYDRFTENKDLVDRKKFQELYDYACVFNHLFYYSKYAKQLLNTNRYDKDLLIKSYYHLGMLKNTINILKENNGEIKGLLPWIDTFGALLKNFPADDSI